MTSLPSVFPLVPFLRIYEQLPEVQKKREEEKRRSEYKSYRLRAQLYKKVSGISNVARAGWARFIKGERTGEEKSNLLSIYSE